MNTKISIQNIDEAFKKLKNVAHVTPLQFNKRLSEQFRATVYLKREDLQEVRSYKIRGAYNFMITLSNGEKKRGVICASAGNHAQGVAQSAFLLKIKAVIFMPVVTPLQKINRVKNFGKNWVEIKLVGQTFDEANAEANKVCKEENKIFVHPFDDYRTINGQGTVGKEIYEKLNGKIDYLICPIGGGGLISGTGSYIKIKKPEIKIIGAEPQGAASMHSALKSKKVVTLYDIDTFVDGAAVKTVGEKTFEITQKIVDKIVLVPEGKVCSTMIDLYQNEGIVAEPAGALSIAALDFIKEKIKGKTVVCILSGGNNDILRYPEVMEKSLIYQGLKHYFILEFAQKPGQLKKFVNHALGPGDDIVRFEYIKKTSKEMGPALVGIELGKKERLKPFLERLDEIGIEYKKITHSDLLYNYLI